MKTVGIIGGFGPETTAKFYLEVFFKCFLKNKKVKPPMLIWNVPLPYEIEHDLILKSQGEERYLPYLIEAAKKLEIGGADFLVLPCNSLHIFIKEIRISVQIPVLSIIEETAKVLVTKNIKKVGILATKTTLQSKVYENKFLETGILSAIPDKQNQTKIGKIINHLVSNKHTRQDQTELIDIIKEFKKQNIHRVILACTDLQLIIPKIPGLKIFDTMKILAEATVREILTN